MTGHFQQQRGRRNNLSIIAVVLLVALLIIPSLAILRLARSLDPRLVLGYLVGISGLTLLLYFCDKRRAEAGGWRTPESTLHLVELLGGWPAAFLAQRTFRHKISKTSYQVAFWVIVILHEAVSFDFLSGWHYLQAAIKLTHQ
jgi:uncharacterized membrane protein YsdA (DUF1294 family)